MSTDIDGQWWGWVEDKVTFLTDTDTLYVILV